MITINLVKLIGSSSLLSSQKGITLYEELKNFLNEHNQLILDFAGYEYLSSIFINRSFGQLCVDKGWNIDELYKHIELKNVSDEDLASIELAVSNANHRHHLISQNIDPEKYYSSACTF